MGPIQPLSDLEQGTDLRPKPEGLDAFEARVVEEVFEGARCYAQLHTQVLKNPEILAKPLSQKEYIAIRLYMGGISKTEICKRTSLSTYELQKAFLKEEAKILISQIAEERDLEFKALEKSVTQTIQDGLSYPKMEVRLAAANTWLKYGKTQKVQMEISAEDIVRRLLSPTKDKSEASSK